MVTSDQLAKAMAFQSQINASQSRVFKLGEILLFQKALNMQQLHEALRQQTQKVEAHRREIKAIQQRAAALKSIADSSADDEREISKAKKDEDSISRIFSFLKKKNAQKK